MIPSEHATSVIQTGLMFLKAITIAYGTEEGMKLWDAMNANLDPDVKGSIFFAMVTGTYEDSITLQRVRANANKIEIIKKIREVTGDGLKEAKDKADELFAGRKISLDIGTEDGFRRQDIIKEFNWLGVTI